MSEEYRPNSVDAVLARVEQKVDGLIDAVSHHETTSTTWRTAHEKSDFEQFESIKKQLDELKSYAYKLIGGLIVVGVVLKYVL